MFPIGSLYIFNRPDLQDRLLGKESVASSMGVPEADLVKDIPRTKAEIAAAFQQMKSANEQKKTQNSN